MNYSFSNNEQPSSRIARAAAAAAAQAAHQHDQHLRLPPSPGSSWRSGNHCSHNDNNNSNSHLQANVGTIANNNISNSNNKSAGPKPVYTYDLTYTVRKSLFDLMDADSSWRTLAGTYLGQTDQEITLLSHALLRNASPTGELLQRWEQQNPKIDLLFRHLLGMRHFRAINILKPFVDPGLAVYCDNENESSFPVQQQQQQQLQYNSSDGCLGAAGGACGGRMIAGAAAAAGPPPLPLPPTPALLLPPAPRNHGKHHAADKEVNAEVKASNWDTGSELFELDDGMDLLYKELMLGTDDFDEKRIIGSGGFGVVYRGTLKGTEVAIKRLKGLANMSQAITELKILNRYRIDNIVPVYGISLDGPDACIVYQFMPNGSLEDRLLCKHATPALTWDQRTRIGEGVAKGLNYLHTRKDRPLVHGDVKSANVLLDARLEAKLGDFGLSRLVSGMEPASGYTHMTVTQVHGTSVYLPDEYLRHKKLSPAVDTYSYGVVVLEMATGRRAYDGKQTLVQLVEDAWNSGGSDAILQLKDGRAHRRPHPAQALDVRPDEEEAALADDACFHSLITLGRDCANKLRKKRPSMDQVLDYYSQVKTRDRARRTSVESAKRATSPSSSSSPPPPVPLLQSNQLNEMQRWFNHHVRKETPASSVCATLPSSSSPAPSSNISNSSSSSNRLQESVFDSQSTDASSVRRHNGQSRDSTYDDGPPSAGPILLLPQAGSQESIIPLITELGITSSEGHGNSSSIKKSQ